MAQAKTKCCKVIVYEEGYDVKNKCNGFLCRKCGFEWCGCCGPNDKVNPKCRNCGATGYPNISWQTQYY